MNYAVAGIISAVTQAAGDLATRRCVAETHALGLPYQRVGVGKPAETMATTEMLRWSFVNPLTPELQNI